VFVDDLLVGEVIRLIPSPGGYDMVQMKDLRPGHHHGIADIPYVKAWFTLDLSRRRIDLSPPEGLLDVNAVN
jgi:16S rRNA processing protein RimM